MSVCVTSPGKFTYENRSNFSVPVSADRTQQPKGGIQTVMKSQKERQDRERERERIGVAVCRIVRGRTRNASVEMFQSCEIRMKIRPENASFPT